MFAFVSAFPKSLHCTDEAQQAKTVLSAVLSIYIYVIYVCGPVEHSWPGAPYCCKFRQASRKFEVSWYGVVVLRLQVCTDSDNF